MTSNMYSRVFRELANELTQTLTIVFKTHRELESTRKNANLPAIIKKEKTEDLSLGTNSLTPLFREIYYVRNVEKSYGPALNFTVWFKERETDSTYPLQHPHKGSRSGNKLQKIVNLLRREHTVPLIFLGICTLSSVYSF